MVVTFGSMVEEGTTVGVAVAVVDAVESVVVAVAISLEPISSNTTSVLSTAASSDITRVSHPTPDPAREYIGPANELCICHAVFPSTKICPVKFHC